MIHFNSFPSVYINLSAYWLNWRTCTPSFSTWDQNLHQEAQDKISGSMNGQGAGVNYLQVTKTGRSAWEESRKGSQSSYKREWAGREAEKGTVKLILVMGCYKEPWQQLYKDLLACYIYSKCNNELLLRQLQWQPWYSHNNGFNCGNWTMEDSVSVISMFFSMIARAVWMARGKFW